MNDKNCWRTAAVCLLLFLGSVALFSPALTYQFVDYDDQLYVVHNPRVNHGFTASGVKWAFQAGYAANWHPLTWFSHMLDCQLFQLRPGWHHLTNLLLHAANAVLVFLLLQRLSGAFWRGAMVAALFAWHPLHVESVAWIADRKDVLSAFFFLLTLYAYARYAGQMRDPAGKPALWYVSALVLFALALMSKPIVVTLPLILLLLDWWPLGRFKGSPQPGAGEPTIKEPQPRPDPLWQQMKLAADPESPLAQADPAPTKTAEVPPSVEDATPPSSASNVTPEPEPLRGHSLAFLFFEKIPFFCVAIVTTILAVFAQRREGSLSFVSNLPLKSRLVMAVNAYYRYLVKTVWPTDLGPVYPAYLNRMKWEIIAIGLVLLAISVFAIQLRRQRPFWLTGWFWFAIMIFPTTNVLVPGGQPMADRYTYLAGIGLFILICWEAYDLLATTRLRRKVLAGLAVAALAACCTASAVQLRIWKDDAALFARIAIPDENFTGHANYAAYLMHHGQLAQAEAECSRAVQISPRYGILYGLLGDIFDQERKYDRAIDTLNTALRLDPTLVDARLPLGRALIATKRPQEAEAQFDRIVQAEPRNFEAHAWLGKVLQLQGRSSDALQQFHLALQLNPNLPDVLNDAAWLLTTERNPKLRNPTLAVQLSTRACKLTGNQDPMLLGTLGAAYAAAGRFDDAVAAAGQASKIAEAQGRKSIADRNRELIQLYRAHKPYQEK